MVKAISIKFNHWPDPVLFPNKARRQLHWAQRAEYTQAAKEEAYWMAFRKLEEPFEKATIEIFVTAGDKRRRDLDSFVSAVKSWLDGIVLAGIIKDDNYFCVPKISIIFNGVSEKQVTIVITKIEN